MSDRKSSAYSSSGRKHLKKDIQKKKNSFYLGFFPYFLDKYSLFWYLVFISFFVFTVLISFPCICLHCNNVSFRAVLSHELRVCLWCHRASFRLYQTTWGEWLWAASTRQSATSTDLQKSVKVGAAVHRIRTQASRTRTGLLNTWERQQLVMLFNL